MTLIKPKRIYKGERIGIFSPSDPIYSRRIPFILEGLKILQTWGFKPDDINEYDFNIWSELRSPLERAREFNRLVVNKSCSALLATWGGKNVSDILQLVNYDLVKEHQKVIFGSSDIAVLLNAITAKTNLLTFYGPNVLGKLNQTCESGLPLISDTIQVPFEFNLNGSLSPVAVIPGCSTGHLVGGSLGTFTLGLSGTKYIPNFAKMIFFFESGSLDLFRIRQHLRHLELTGFLDNVTGVLIGAMTKIEDTKNLDLLLSEIFSPRSCPVVRCDAFGHGYFNNPMIPIGPVAELRTNPCRLTIFEALTIE